MNGTRRAWTDEENEKIRDLAGRLPPTEISRQLNRTEGSTRVQASKLGISLKLGSKISTSLGRRAALKGSEVETIIGPAAIERALSIYQQLQQHDPSVMSQARKILTQHVFGMIDQGEYDEHRLMVGGLARLKAVERDHEIKSAREPGQSRKR
jgi:hypothetical protein